jgi:hypothetical protein
MGQNKYLHIKASHVEIFEVSDLMHRTVTRPHAQDCNLGITAGGCELILPDQKGVVEFMPDGHFRRPKLLFFKKLCNFFAELHFFA